MSKSELDSDSGQKTNTESPDKYIIFELNTEKIAIPLDIVQEVLEITKYRSVPKMSHKLVGIYNLRNEILPIIDLKTLLFNQKRKNEKEEIIRCIVLKIQKEIIGLSVDKILQIIDAEQIETENLPNLVETYINMDQIEYIGLVQDNPVIVLDILSIMKTRLFEDLDLDDDDDYEYSRDESGSDESDYEGNELKLSQKQLDSLKEVANIASGKASTAMSKLFKEQSAIGINIEDVNIKYISDMSDAKTFKAGDRALGIRALIKNDLEGAIYLLIPSKEIGNLLGSLSGVEKPKYEIEEMDDLSQKAVSALTEVGNIIISHYCAGISDFLKIKLVHEVPQLALEDYAALVDSEIVNYSRDAESLIFLETSIVTKGNTINAAILLLPKPEYVHNFMNLMNVDSIVSILNQEADGASPLDIQKTQAKKLKNKQASNVKIKTESDKKESKKDEKTKKTLQEEEVFQMIQFQKDYEISASDKTALKINDEDLDTFRELGNIGAGNAGNALSQILNKKVLLEIPPAKLVPVSDAITGLAEKNTMLVGYAGFMKGFLESNIFLSLPVEDIENLLQIILDSDTKKELTKESDLNNTEKSAITEVFNILMGHYIAALSDFLKIKTEPPEYRFFFGKANNIFKALGADVTKDDTKAVVVETSIKVADGPVIRGKFIMFLNPSIVHKVIDRITEIW